MLNIINLKYSWFRGLELRSICCNSQVNTSPYEEGWIIKVELSDAGEAEKLMDSDKYSKFCEEEDAKHWAFYLFQILLKLPLQHRLLFSQTRIKTKSRSLSNGLSQENYEDFDLLFSFFLIVWIMVESNKPLFPCFYCLFVSHFLTLFGIYLSDRAPFVSHSDSHSNMFCCSFRRCQRWQINLVSVASDYKTNKTKIASRHHWTPWVSTLNNEFGNKYY